jgi:hypothetical protein
MSHNHLAKLGGSQFFVNFAVHFGFVTLKQNMIKQNENLQEINLKPNFHLIIIIIIIPVNTWSKLHSPFFWWIKLSKFMDTVTQN